MASEFFPELSQDFSQLLADDTNDYNVVIKVGEKSDTKEFHAHSNILRARSPYFKKAFSQNRGVTKKNDIFNIIKPNISPIVFEMIIRYMYVGILDLREKTNTDILNLLIASDELLMQELITCVQKYLVENEAKWLQDNFAKILHTVFQFESCKQLQDYCLESICEDSEPFLNSSKFPTLEKNILLGLLKRDDLTMDEIELWDNLIRWGIAQNSELNGKNITNLNRWNKKDFLILKNTLDPFISHIRYFNISSEDFHSKIWPFKRVLPEALFENIISFYFADVQPENKLPPRYGKLPVDSIIIKPKHAAILANWTQRKDTNAKILENRYTFNLVYRGSRDGFDIETMRNNCNDQGATILVIKVEENGFIIGGYNPLGWNYGNYYGEGWKYATESFIFSLGDGKDSKKFKISRVTDENYALYETNYSLDFGNSDLIINGTNGTCYQCYYESNILDTNNFSIEEMEIFSFY
ncbi:BTB/POZ protein [Rhizophagus irregularis DAOM 181602=DAOM 197198]|uniref:Serine-enriched protein n=3 Tax=Rhizophagus irregularis TaxID=588596 RepID=U9T414_RHIID|nr:hypothetical protein GLOIN_2v1487724 [Rhizophagus irregularis DAOM 181602=DAOM 197198]EXX57433.1 hypothetical protein RirG_207160 [Rhizophagus irregularis DAOM 197198w]POG59546.1 hypothetical protein GLOIN_2v1487724 [Rhizophagus irregularis DAOM 181602=DAOM 197198]GET64134.1 BTB/POZ protein [Rhizophagus irregularis DAOM 181602=DAOM 197198]|eukprot:XP_025166412.1 hypothetical protein GLOIN_2v1487724 [Rhizophagus irregularis DAOM 181602=DAOM 197198]